MGEIRGVGLVDKEDNRFVLPGEKQYLRTGMITVEKREKCRTYLCQQQA
jgi:hypothetical protein